jgi:Protein of unknown function (DUF3800)
MYFCYADESGDAGLFSPEKPDKTGSPYLIYTAIIIRDVQWKQALNIQKNFRKKIAAEAYLEYDKEFHCAEMIDVHKNMAYASISVADRWKLIEEYGHTIGKVADFKIIAVVLNKRLSKLEPANYITEIVTKLYQAYNHFLNSKKEHGIMMFDRANDRKISTHVRKLLGTGVSDQPSGMEQLNWILEDPFYKISADSMFIQSADVTAYTLKEQEFPQASRKKFDADLIFKRKLASNCYLSPFSGVDGIIRL